MLEQIANREGPRLDGVFTPTGFGDVRSKGALISRFDPPEVLGLNWLRGPVLRLAERLGRVPEGVADAAEAGASWQEIHAATLAVNGAGGGAEGSRLLGVQGQAGSGGGRAVSAAALDFAASIPGEPGAALSPVQRSIAIEQGRQLGIAGDDLLYALSLRDSAAAKGTTLRDVLQPASDATASGARSAAAASGGGQAAVGVGAEAQNGLRTFVDQGFDVIGGLHPKYQGEVLADIAAALGAPTAAKQPADVLLRVLQAEPLERLAPAMQQGFDTFAGRYPQGLPAIVDDAARIVQNVVRPSASAADDAARAASAAPGLLMSVDDAIRAALRLL